MPKYSYKAIDKNGKTITGVLEADSVETANNSLAALGYIPSKVTESINISSKTGWQGIKKAFSSVNASELAIFTKQFKTMVRAGVPIMTLLQVLEDQTENLNLKNIINSMKNDIEEGAGLYDAFKKHPETFSPLYCSMIQAGEASGALPDVMERLIYIIERENKIKSDIKAALQYPVIVIIFLTGAFFMLLTFVIPRFVNIFTRAEIDLPVPTRICLFLYHFMTDYWYLLLAFALIAAVWLHTFLRTRQGKYFRDVFLMKVPVIGPLFIKAAMARFAGIFSILQSSGVAVLDSIKILSGTIGNAAITREFDLISERLEEGRGIAEPLRSAKYFTPIVVNMVAIGEETGKLEEMLEEISQHYDVELEYAVKKLSEAIGPVLTIGLACVVGFFALAIFLPMWDLTKMVK